MKKEFMLFIRNAADTKAALSPAKHLELVKKCETYIDKLKAEGKLISAQPILREGFIITKKGSYWTNVPTNPTKERQVGYYHIIASNINEAIAIAKDNPEFDYLPSATIEVRPIKMKEEKTNFVYPNS